jgi:hypothetical protein
MNDGIFTLNSAMCIPIGFRKLIDKKLFEVSFRRISRIKFNFIEFRIN